MNVREIINATNGILLSGDENLEIIGFSQDSRKIKAGMMYIPLIGERFDGHDFIESAFANGASAIISDRDIKSDDKVVIKVVDTLKALQNGRGAGVGPVDGLQIRDLPDKHAA